ncbi:MAG: hypothetical protein U9O96_08675 [Candidatus Thermoplasmatota archaeon]|nr:hypothetical protein [Candidatus Thermoplasmatota archaeon]
MRKMRKVVFLLLTFVLLMFSLPVQEPVRAGIIPWEEWSNFWWNVQTEPIGDPTATVEPLGGYEFHFRFWNGGVVQGESKVPLRYYLKITDITGEGWQASVSPTFVYLGQGESYNATVYVTAGVKPSYIANITCQIAMHVKMTSFIKYGNITFQVRSKAYRWLGVDVENPVVKGKQEGIYTVVLDITNNGNYDDEYIISVPYAPRNWIYALSEQQVHLFPGESTRVNLTFYIPHERLYIQYENYLMQVKVQSVNDPGYHVTKPIVVSLSGFHMTVGQLAVFASAMPSLMLLIVLGVALSLSGDPCRQIPKPWKEKHEKERLSKLAWKEYMKEKKLMKEEWKSAFYYCKGERERKQKLKKLMGEKIRKQKLLERKIIGEWKKAWMIPHQEWKKQCSELKDEYERKKRKLFTKWREANGKIKRVNSELGCQIPLIPKPELSPPKMLPEPGKLPKPRIPGYEVDSKRLALIKPDETLVKKILLPLRRGKNIAKMESEKIRRMGNSRKEKLGLEFTALDKRLDTEIKGANNKIKMGRERLTRNRRIKERRQRVEEEKRKERQRIEEEKRRLRERMAGEEKRKKEKLVRGKSELKKRFGRKKS